MIAFGQRPVTSILFITFVSFIHVVEGYLLIRHITVADWIFPMRAFLFVTGGSHVVSGASISICGLSGLCALFFRSLPLNLRIAMFMIQALPLILVSLWIIGWAWIGLDAYGDYQSTLALLLNQAPRIWWAGAYPVAVLCVLNRQ